MKCIGGSVDVQSGGSGKWRRRRLWIDSGPDRKHNGPDFTLYLRVRGGGVNYLRKNGTVAGSRDHYWRWLKLPTGFELYEGEDYPTVVHVHDIILATKTRLGII